MTTPPNTEKRMDLYMLYARRGEGYGAQLRRFQSDVQKSTEQTQKAWGATNTLSRFTDLQEEQFSLPLQRVEPSPLDTETFLSLRIEGAPQFRNPTTREKIQELRDGPPPENHLDGVVRGVTFGADNLCDAIEHPIKTIKQVAKGLYTIATHPLKTVEAVQQWSDTFAYSSGPEKTQTICEFGFEWAACPISARLWKKAAQIEKARLLEASLRNLPEGWQIETLSGKKSALKIKKIADAWFEKVEAFREIESTVSVRSTKKVLGVSREELSNLYSAGARADEISTLCKRSIIPTTERLLLMKDALGRPKGIALIDISEKGPVWLSFLTVNPENFLPTTKTKGVGKALLKEIELIAPKQDIRCVAFSDVVDFYKKSGFQVVSEGSGRVTVEMIKTAKEI